MTRIKLQNVPRLKLTDLIRRRKSTLSVYMRERGIVTHQGLTEECARIGVATPTLEEFDAAKFEARLMDVNSPREGVVILDALPVIDETTGRRIDPDAPPDVPGITVITGDEEQPFVPTMGTQKVFFKKTKPTKPPQE